MNELKVFTNEEFGEVRTVVKDGEPMFALSDLCRILEISNTSQAKTRLNKDGVITNEVIDNLGRTQQATFVNESNLYKLIFQSRKPQAEKFSDWVTSEVLPSIRKNGGYITNQENLTPEQIVANALVVAQNIIKNQKLQLQKQEPLVSFAEHVSESVNSISVGEFSKLLADENIKMGQNRLFKWLKKNKFLMSDNVPYQKYIDSNYFKVIEQTYSTPYGEKTSFKTLITGKGQIFFTEKLRVEFN